MATPTPTLELVALALARMFASVLLLEVTATLPCSPVPSSTAVISRPSSTLAMAELCIMFRLKAAAIWMLPSLVWAVWRPLLRLETMPEFMLWLPVRPASFPPPAINWSAFWSDSPFSEPSSSSPVPPDPPCAALPVPLEELVAPFAPARDVDLNMLRATAFTVRLRLFTLRLR